VSPGGRAVAVGVFDGVHVGHRRVLAALVASGDPRVLTVHPHPRPGTKLISTLERRLELIREAGIDDVHVVAPDSSVRLGDALLVSGPQAEVRHPPERIVHVPLVEGVSSERIRQLVSAAELEGAAKLLGRPFEVEGTVVEGDRRGRGLGIPTANLDVASNLLLPPYGIYAGAAGGPALEPHRAAVSIGVNPQYGGSVQRVEAFVLDFDGDLYGQRLVVELWQRLRDEAAFESEGALLDQIALDVEATRRAGRPSGR